MTGSNRYVEYRLDNGLRVALQNTQSETIFSKVRVNYGFCHQRKGEEGLAHFLEHCLVSGGSRKHSPEEAAAIRGSFGYFNAITSIGRTDFAAGFLPRDMEDWLSLISEVLFYPRFDKEKVEGERGRVLRETADEKSSVYFNVDRLFSRRLYRGHPKGIFGLGNERVVAHAGIEELRHFHSRGYRAANVDLIIAGALPKDIEKLVEKYFGDKRAGRDLRRKFPELKPLEKRTIVHVSSPELYNKDNPENSSAMLYLKMVTAPRAHEDHFAIIALSKILGGGANSRFFKTLGLERGLAYRIGSEYDGSYNAGILRIDAAVPALKVEESLDCIFDEIIKLREENTSSEELERIKKAVEFTIAQAYDTNNGHVDVIETKIDYGITLRDVIRGYESLTSQRLKDAAIKYFPVSRKKGFYTLGIADPLKPKTTKEQK